MTFGGAVLVAGGAGFVGSHLVDRLLAESDVERVTVYDNFSSGRASHLGVPNARLRVVRGDLRDLDALTAATRGHETVVHLASNADIARAATEPAIDFHEGTELTNNVLEAMRLAGAHRILYASGSGVYGDAGHVEVDEDFGPLRPISTYGASKLAGEALIGAYCHLFGLTACAFRFGNVVGPRQTHGVGLDLLRQLHGSPGRLRILGDGTQSKPYVHVTDAVEAVLVAAAAREEPFRTYNVAPPDSLTVREIADLAVECVCLPRGSVEYVFTGGSRGWKGDVPVVRLDTSRIRRLGWRSTMSSREAVRRSLRSISAGATAGRAG